jgi:hypothetical protein
MLAGMMSLDLPNHTDLTLRRAEQGAGLGALYRGLSFPGIEADQRVERRRRLATVYKPGKPAPHLSSVFFT